MRLLICKVAGHRYFDLQDIYARFPTSYKRFHDICGGSGAILLSKQHDVEYECLNDYNVQFFQMYYHLKFMPKSFQHIVNIVPESGHLFGLTLRIRFGGKKGGDRNQEGADCFTWDECSHFNFIRRNISLNGDCMTYSPVAAKYYAERVRSIPLIAERLKNVKIDALRASVYLEKPLTQDDFVIIDLPTKDTLMRDCPMSKREYQETVGACLMSDAKIMVIHEQPEEYFSSWRQSVGRTFTISTNY